MDVKCPPVVCAVQRAKIVLYRLRKSNDKAFRKVNTRNTFTLMI